MEEIKGLGASLVALSSDDAETAEMTIEALQLTYTVLPDPNREIIRRFGVLHPQEGISRPATFIIDAEGVIRFQHIGKDFSDRPNESLIVNTLRWL